MDLKDQKGMILAAFIISGLLITGYAMFRSGASDTPIYGSGGYGEPIPMPVNIQQSHEDERRVQELLVQDPGNPLLLAKLGDIFYERGDFNKAVLEYKKVLQLAPDDVDTYNDLGLAYHFTGRPEEALSSFQKGIEVDPSFQRIWLSLGFVQASNKNLTAAQEALKKAIEIAPASSMGLESKRILDSISQ
ncbi:hypothetical protein LCGC14_2315570 [marine sediment metagenome]|uniref:Uncharacterized protein n=1 Tax=marine sediment metagenome TaxID=412755 RepID=A0A0F9CJF7_9ZZZZ